MANAVLLLSCTGSSPVREQLLRAEQLMEADSRAAATVLDSIDSSTLRGEEAALYALLRTQADYKSRIRLTSDSLPLIATRYYGTKWKGYRAALSQYYLGCAYGDMHRDLDAFDALLRATTLFPDTTSKYFAYSFYELGLLYERHLLHAKALNAYQQFKHSSVCQNDSLNIGYADYGMAHTYLILKNSECADSLFRQVITNPFLSTKYKSDAYFQLAKLSLHINHLPDDALYYLEKSIHLMNEDQLFGALYSLKADIFSSVQQYDSAYYYNKKALLFKKEIYTLCWVNKQLAETSLALGKTDSVGFFYRNMSLCWIL